MAVQRISYPDRESWLNGRTRGIGASEAAAVVGFSPWMSAVELWETKTGRRERKDVSGNDAVKRGVSMEGAVRDFFLAAHPEYTAEHHPYDILFQEERPWLFATLDGELVDRNGRRGILEVKTAAPQKREEWKQWDGRVPDHYMAQVLHQLLATGYDFAVLTAALWSRNGDVTLKDPYQFEREDLTADIDWLLEKETRFWTCVEQDRMPGMVFQF